ncbi:MAG: hypothetical protein Q7K25_01515 [Actinomycetota bacterium]|nr:hypothetical protein [Actinomycetota bacterium]
MKKVLVVIAAAGLLAACSSSTTDSTPSPEASSTSASAELAAWAGQVCTDTANLRTSITDIGAAVTAGGADLQTLVGQQFVLIQEAASTLVSTVGAIPSDSTGPDATAIQETSADLNTEVQALGTSIGALQDASGVGIGMALLSVGTAIGNASQAAVASVQAIDSAINNRAAAIGQAFQANPSCADLTTEQQ